jgi:CBS domain-containing protein
MSSLRLLKDLVIHKHGGKKLFVLYPKQGLDAAFEYMFTNKVHHLPVVEEGSDKLPAKGDYISSGNLVGIITDRDLRLAVQSPLLLVAEKDEKRKSFEESFDDMSKWPY